MARADSSVIISRFRLCVNPFFNLFLTLFESFSSESGFSRDKSCIFLRYCWKNAEFGSFAFNRKICGNPPSGFASLPDYYLFAGFCLLFPLEPVSIAECFAFCAETTFLFLKWGYVGLLPKPAWGFTPNPSKELRSLHPFSAARGSQAGNQKIAYSFFSYCFSIASICALAAFCAS